MDRPVDDEGMQLLPRRAARCPNCGAPGSQIQRWPQPEEAWRAACTRCDHAWLEASRRSLREKLLPRGDVLVFAVMTGILVIGIAIIVFALLRTILEVSDSAAFAATIVACLVSLVVIGKMRA